MTGPPAEGTVILLAEFAPDAPAARRFALREAAQLGFLGNRVVSVELYRRSVSGRRHTWRIEVRLGRRRLSPPEAIPSFAELHPAGAAVRTTGPVATEYARRRLAIPAGSTGRVVESGAGAGWWSSPVWAGPWCRPDCWRTSAGRTRAGRRGSRLCSQGAKA